MSEPAFVRLQYENHTHLQLLKEFLSNAGKSVESFRYYSKRELSVIKNHLVTLLLLKDGIPVAYGHLDKEGGKVWLGIAVVESEKGKGIGQHMMNKLLSFPPLHAVKEVFLSVDTNNTSAIKLYEKSGFIKVDNLSDTVQLMILKS